MYKKLKDIYDFMVFSTLFYNIYKLLVQQFILLYYYYKHIQYKKINATIHELKEIKYD